MPFETYSWFWPSFFWVFRKKFFLKVFFFVLKQMEKSVAKKHIGYKTIGQSLECRGMGVRESLWRAMAGLATQVLGMRSWASKLTLLLS